MVLAKDNAQIRLPPPLVFLTLLLLGFALNRFYPQHFISDEFRSVLASLLIVPGVLLIGYCIRTFIKMKTNVEPWKPTHRIVTSGLYRFTRNPIYLSYLLVGLGIASGLNNAWMILLMIFWIPIVHHTSVLKEEKYLEKKFGGEYLNYKKRVKRWL